LWWISLHSSCKAKAGDLVNAPNSCRLTAPCPSSLSHRSLSGLATSSSGRSSSMVAA
jgi:hypothetical protein